MADPNPIYTAPQITADQDNYDPDPDEAIFAILWRVSSDAARSISGFAGNEFEGDQLPTRLLFWANVGAFPITLLHESGLSSAGNRFTFALAVDKVLAAGETICLLYDSESDRWRQSTV